MKFKFKIIFIYLVSGFLFAGCGDSFLDFKPKGTLTAEDLTTPDKIDPLVTAAYASLGNDFWDRPITHMWLWGSIRSDDAYKGGGSVADQGEYNQYEQFNLMTVDQSRGSLIWETLYAAISRSNFALHNLNNIQDADFPKKKLRQGELRFLRGHFHFLLKVLFKYMPYATEELSEEELRQLDNRALTNDQLWNKIAEDLQFAVENLPESQPEVGRVNKWAAMAYLAKVRLYQAYEQDETNSVTKINTQRLEEVVALTDAVIKSGRYRLNDDFAKNFLFGYENGPESVFAVQYSNNDGTSIGRINMGTSLNYNQAPDYGCCWFHIPSQNLINSFKTDDKGVPMFDTFNDVPMTAPADFMTNGVDPRLDHTVGIPGHPFKYQPDKLFSRSWTRAPDLYGSHGSMKELQAGNCTCFKKVGPFYGTSVNWDIIRFADVMLWQAEALIELNRSAEALPLINQIRARAKNSTGRTKMADGSNPSNYRIGEYVDGQNINWTQANARKAMQWERRLEFAMESPRFFDLVRWGIAAETLNSYFGVEKTRKAFLNNAKFTKGRDEYLPIPQQQINFTEGLYTQNNGW